MLDPEIKKQLENIRKISDKVKPLVAIICTTYNHESYLRDALNSFVMQQTTFPFIAIIHDDASTDSTTEILREYAKEYPEIIVPIYETENQYSKKNNQLGHILDEAFLVSNAKYLAWCEGDDYWIDRLKLQKQVDALENNPECTGCYSAFDTIDCNGNKIHRPFSISCINKSKSGYQFHELIKGNYIQTCTFMVHKKVLESELYLKRLNNIDYFLFLTTSYLGSMIFINEPLSAYRINPNGVTNTQLKNLGTLCNVTQLYFWNLAIETNNSIIKKPFILKYLWRTEHHERQTNKYNTIKKINKKYSFLFIISGIIWLAEMTFKKLNLKRI